MTTLLIIMLLCVLVEAFFSGSEMAVVSVHRSHMRHLMEKGSVKAKAVFEALEHPEWLLGTTLLGTNIATLTLNAMATFFVKQNYGHESEFLTLLVTVPLGLILGEAIPKAVFQRYADRLALELIFPLKVVSMVLSPLVASVAFVARKSVQWVGVRINKKTPFITREELELLLQASQREATLKDTERKMVDRVLGFSKKMVREIMIPLVDVVSVDEQSSLSEAKKLFSQCGFSRMPVFDERVDYIKGWISHFDVLGAKDQSIQVKDILRPTVFVPGTVHLDTLLITLQRKGESLAQVVDEYGGVIGMVTLEDVIEEVVGDIEDEHDVASQFVRRVDANALVINARMPLTQLSELTSIRFSQGPYETLGGFLLHQFEKVPVSGEVFWYQSVRFKILKADHLSVEEVEMRV